MERRTWRADEGTTKIEFKLGTLIDKRTNKRLVIPGIKSECGGSRLLQTDSTRRADQWLPRLFAQSSRA